MGINITAQQAADKWKRRLQSSTEDIRNGVNAVDESPMEAAARNPDKYVQGVQAAVASGKWQGGLRRVTLQSWKDATLNKGLPRISTGAEAAVGKVGSFYADLFPYEARLQDEVSSMPDTTIEDSIARMTAWARGMSRFKRS